MLILAGLLAATGLWSPPSHAASVLQLDLEAHLQASTTVVEGWVVGTTQHFGEPGRRPYTTTDVQVDQVLYGHAPDVVTIRQEGGTYDGVTARIVGDGSLHQGERVVLFVKEWDDGYWYLTALAQSVYHVQGEEEGAPVERDLSGLDLLQWAPGGGPEHIEATVDPYLDTLSRLRDAVRAAGGGVR
jgi:hypothetical protein